MGQHSSCATTSGNHVNDTIAFGSMLVFASVMPPLGADMAGTDAQRATRHVDAPASVTPSAAKKPAARPRRRFDS